MQHRNLHRARRLREAAGRSCGSEHNLSARAAAEGALNQEARRGLGKKSLYQRLEWIPVAFSDRKRLWHCGTAKLSASAPLVCHLSTRTEAERDVLSIPDSTEKVLPAASGKQQLPTGCCTARRLYRCPLPKKALVPLLVFKTRFQPNWWLLSAFASWCLPWWFGS